MSDKKQIIIYDCMGHEEGKKLEWIKGGEVSEIGNEPGKEFEVDLFEKMNPGLIERLSKAGIEGARAGKELAEAEKRILTNKGE